MSERVLIKIIQNSKKMKKQNTNEQAPDLVLFLCQNDENNANLCGSVFVFSLFLFFSEIILISKGFALEQKKLKYLKTWNTE